MIKIMYTDKLHHQMPFLYLIFLEFLAYLYTILKGQISKHVLLYFTVVNTESKSLAQSFSLHSVYYNSSK